MHVLRTREPDFTQLEKVCRREASDYPVLFEIFMDGQYYEYFSGKKFTDVKPNSVEEQKLIVDAFYNAGYDYATAHGSEFGFPRKEQSHSQSISINDGSVIFDRESFNAYQWMNPDECDYSKLDKIKDYLPGKMRLVGIGPSGVLENVTALVGYDNMCFMTFEDPELLQDIFNKVGSLLLKHYENMLEHDTIGGIISNDDWGFNTQTFLSTADMRKYVFPWHKKIVAAAHKKGKFAILHSCGCMNEVFEDIIDDMKFDGKHSYEDNIYSVEKSFEKWGSRIAIIGGLDLNYLITASTEDVAARAKALADLGVQRGGYALGSGNSLCFYIPEDKVHILLNTANNY